MGVLPTVSFMYLGGVKCFIDSFIRRRLNVRTAHRWLIDSEGCLGGTARSTGKANVCFFCHPPTADNLSCFSVPHLETILIGALSTDLSLMVEGKFRAADMRPKTSITAVFGVLQLA